MPTRTPVNGTPASGTPAGTGLVPPPRGPTRTQVRAKPQAGTKSARPTDSGPFTGRIERAPPCTQAFKGRPGGVGAGPETRRVPASLESRALCLRTTPGGHVKERSHPPIITDRQQRARQVLTCLESGPEGAGRALCHSQKPQGTRVGKRKGAGEGERSQGSAGRGARGQRQERRAPCPGPHLPPASPYPPPHVLYPPPHARPCWRSWPGSAASQTVCPSQKTWGLGRGRHLFFGWRPGARRRPVNDTKVVTRAPEGIDALSTRRVR